jgi:signal transduction histidine kinase
VQFSSALYSTSMDNLARASEPVILAGVLLGLILLAAVAIRWVMRPSRKRTADKQSMDSDGSLSTLQERLKKRQDELEHLRSVLQISGTLNASLNYERVQELSLDLGTAALGEATERSGRGVSALLILEDGGLRVAAARGFPHADMRVRFEGRSGVLAQALGSTRSAVTKNPKEDPELSRLTALHNCKSAVCVPLFQGFDITGLLLFGHSQPDFFVEEHLELLELIAKQAVIALTNAAMYENLAQEKERIKEVQEEARRKLARDLHDGPTQSIGAITMRVNYIRRLLERDPNAAANELYKVEQLARRTTKEMRQMLFALRPLVLEAEGLIPALEHLAKNTEETFGQRVIVESAKDAAAGLDARKQTVVFFVAEEAVANARKHANADEIRVRAWSKGEMFFLSVEDDGEGFDLETLQEGYEQSGSMGMLNLYERAELVSGKLVVDSAPGKGTSVRLAVPQTAEALEKLRSPGYAA